MIDLYLLAFWALLGAALLFSWRAGDRFDRTIIAAIVATAALSTLIYGLFEPVIAVRIVAALDFGLLLIVGRYALAGRRYWPIWFAGFHAATVIFHVIAIFLSFSDSVAPLRLGAFWSLLAIAAMTTGLVLDKRNMPRATL